MIDTLKREHDWIGFLLGLGRAGVRGRPFRSKSVLPEALDASPGEIWQAALLVEQRGTKLRAAFIDWFAPRQ